MATVVALTGGEHGTSRRLFPSLSTSIIIIIIIITLHANLIICKEDMTLLCLTLQARVLRAYTCTHAQSTDSFTYNTYSRFR